MNLSYHYMLMANHVILQKKLFLSLKDTGLTLGQPKVLDFLQEKDGAAQKEIAAACHIEPASPLAVKAKQAVKMKCSKAAERILFYV